MLNVIVKKRTVHLYKKWIWALNNVKRLIYHKTQTRSIATQTQIASIPVFFMRKLSQVSK